MCVCVCIYIMVLFLVSVTHREYQHKMFLTFLKETEIHKPFKICNYIVRKRKKCFFVFSEFLLCTVGSKIEERLRTAVFLMRILRHLNAMQNGDIQAQKSDKKV